MGCGASKDEAETKVHPSGEETKQVKTKQSEVTAVANKTKESAEKPTVKSSKVEKAVKIEKSAIIEPAVKGTASAPVNRKGGLSFDISLDENLHSLSSKSGSPQGSLPKLNADAANEKLKNTDAIWEEMEKKKQSRKKKPQLDTARDPGDVDKIRRKLEEKEAKAEQNRTREAKRVQEKLAKAEAHSRRVSERRQAQKEDGDEEELRIEHGGENEDGYARREEEEVVVQVDRASVASSTPFSSRKGSESNVKKAAGISAQKSTSNTSVNKKGKGKK